MVEKDLTAGLHQPRAGVDYRLWVRDVLQHLHAGDDIVLLRVLRGMFLNRFLNIFHLNTALQGVQFRHLQRLCAHVQSGDRRAFARHTLGEDAAAAADIEDFLPNRPPERSAI